MCKALLDSYVFQIYCKNGDYLAVPALHTSGHITRITWSNLQVLDSWHLQGFQNKRLWYGFPLYLISPVEKRTSALQNLLFNDYQFPVGWGPVLSVDYWSIWLASPSQPPLWSGRARARLTQATLKAVHRVLGCLLVLPTSVLPRIPFPALCLENSYIYF